MKRTRVLVTPLDWGLGHATRCIPIVKLLLECNCEVTLAGCGYSLAVLRKEFPNLPCLKLPGYRPLYPSNMGSMTWAMFTQLCKFRRVIAREHQIIEQYTLTNHIDFIFSDNRYGCWSRYAYNVFITHQTNIRMPSGLRWMEPMLNYFNHKQIAKFNQCWIPDTHEHTFSGELSGNYGSNVKYIGPLSRFSSPVVTSKRYDLLILLSGPEPQRSILEQLLLQQMENIELNTLLVRGVEENLEIKTVSKIKIINFLGMKDLQQAILQSTLIISRPGYSTIMDLARLRKKAIFIPTPGQTEQEYLALYFKQRRIAYAEVQDGFVLKHALSQSAKYTGFEEISFDEQSIHKAIQSVLKTFE